MKTLWTDAGGLSSLNFYLSWIGVALVVLGAIVTAGSILIGRQIEKLNKVEAHSKLNEAHQKITEQTEWIQTIQKNSEILESQIKNLPNWLGPSH